MNENIYNEHIHNNYSYLELILGPMYSGKTSVLHRPKRKMRQTNLKI